MSRRNYQSTSLAPPRKHHHHRRPLPVGARPITPPQNVDNSVFRIAQLEGDNYRLLRERMAWEGAVGRRNERIGSLEQELASTRQDLELTQRENTRATSRNQELERRLKAMEAAHEKRIKEMEAAQKEQEAQHKAELDLLREQLTQQKNRHDTASEAFAQIWSIMNQNLYKGVTVKEEEVGLVN